MDFPGGSDSKASVYNAGDQGSIPGLGRSPGEGNGHPLQYQHRKIHTLPSASSECLLRTHLIPTFHFSVWVSLTIRIVLVSNFQI